MAPAVWSWIYNLLPERNQRDDTTVCKFELDSVWLQAMIQVSLDNIDFYRGPPVFRKPPPLKRRILGRQKFRDCLIALHRLRFVNAEACL